MTILCNFTSVGLVPAGAKSAVTPADGARRVLDASTTVTDLTGPSGPRCVALESGDG